MRFLRNLYCSTHFLLFLFVAGCYSESDYEFERHDDLVGEKISFPTNMIYVDDQCSITLHKGFHDVKRWLVEKEVINETDTNDWSIEEAELSTVYTIVDDITVTFKQKFASSGPNRTIVLEGEKGERFCGGIHLIEFGNQKNG